MNDIEITWKTIIALITGGMVIIEGIKTCINLFKPIKKLQSEIKKHEEILTDDLRRINNVEKGNKVVCTCMLALLENQITGNSIDKLKSAKKELQDYLIQK